MKSPFPGMDPYLEADLWAEVHHELASKIKKLLLPQLGEKYIVRLERYIVKDTNAKAEFGIMYPDIAFFQDRVAEPITAYGKQKIATPPTFTVPNYQPIEVRIPVLHIKDVKNNRLVTAIEILSPVNKRNPGLNPYLEKKQKLLENKVHFLEIDLLRRGQRTIEDKKLADAFYVVGLTRAGSYQTAIWKMDLEAILPVIPIPLLPPDEDILLDLQQAIREVYEESDFHRSIDYTKKPPPPKMSEKLWKKYTITAE